MKPKQLVISGLHSFRQEQIIDFSQVSDTGFFGIFGPTGSGKSTILDAITLSLYGRVERSDANRVGILNQQEDKIHVRFSFDLSSKHGIEQYYVERVYSRNDDIRVKSTLARLVKIENDKDIVLADKEKEVTNAVERLLGLTVDDFTRAVVLPQGKFAEFLTLKAQDRRPMLERLFHLDEYGKKLKNKVQAKEDEHKKVRDEILTKQNMLSHATQESIESSYKLIKELVTTKETFDQRFEEFLSQFKELEQLWEVQGKLQNIKKEFEDLKQQEEYIATLITKKQNAEKAAIIEPTIIQYNRIKKQIAELNTTINDLANRESQLLQKVDSLRIAYEEIQNQHTEHYPKLIDQKYRLQEALGLEAEIDQLKININQNTIEQQNHLREVELLKVEAKQIEINLSGITTTIKELKIKILDLQITTEERKKLDIALESRNNLHRQQLELEVKRAEHRELNIKLQLKADDVEKLKISYESTKAQAEELEIEQKGLEQNKPMSDEDWYFVDKSLSELESNLTRLEEIDQNIAELKKEAENYHAKLIEFTRNIEQKNEELAELDSLIVAKEKELAQLEEQEKINLAVTFAKELENGKPCIVCGSTHHPAPKDDHALDTGIIEAITIAKSELQSLNTEKINKQLELTTIANSLNHTKEQETKLIQELAKREQEYTQLSTTFPKEYTTLNLLEIRSKLLEDRLKQIQAKEHMINWNKQFDLLGKAHAELKKHLENQHREYQLAQAQFDMLNDRAEELVKIISLAEQKYLELDEKWQAVKAYWELDTIIEYKQQLELMDEQREKLEEQLKGWEESLKSYDSKNNVLQEQMQQLNKQLSEIAIAIKNDNASHEKLIDKYNAITNGQSAAELLQHVSQKILTIDTELKQSQTVLQQESDELTKATNNLSTQRAVLINAQQQEKETFAQLNQLMNDYQIEDIATINSYLLANEALAAITKEIKDYEDRKLLLLNRKKQYQDQLLDQEITEDEWNEQLQRKEELTTELEELKHNILEKSIEHKQLEKDYEKWAELETKRKEVQVELDIASELNQVLRGNALVDFIAQEYLQNITIIASDKLRQLTRNRYSLEVEQDGGFRLVDELNGGLSRPVQTLSGGETFLTSLALALSLSSQIQLKGGRILEFFFLDEGFGSLDTDLLDTVMMTLEKLHAGHMTIGIITHVPELQSRINRRIMVIPADTVGGGTRVKIEYN